jgi:hypothetical protein
MREVRMKRELKQPYVRQALLWELDLSASIIRALAAAGLAWNVQQVKLDEERRRLVMDANAQKDI